MNLGLWVKSSHPEVNVLQVGLRFPVSGTHPDQDRTRMSSCRYLLFIQKIVSELCIFIKVHGVCCFCGTTPNHNGLSP